MTHELWMLSKTSGKLIKLGVHLFYKKRMKKIQKKSGEEKH